MAGEYEQFKEQYNNKTDDKLHQIALSEDYTEEARRAARDILHERGCEINEMVNQEKTLDNSWKGTDKKSRSTVGELIKLVSWIQFVFAIIVVIILMFDVGILWGVITLFVCFVAFLVSYALGEICCLLADIKENTKPIN